MEQQVVLTQTLQEVARKDFNLTAKNAALADDRTLAGLLQLKSGAVGKAIIPWQEPLFGAFYPDLVAPATGGVTIAPLRAVVSGLANQDPTAEYQSATTTLIGSMVDVRSAYLVDPSDGYSTLALAANSSGHPRWDLVYLTVSVDAAGATLNRKVKDATTGVVSTQSLVVSRQTTAALHVAQGTPGASPALPSLPADSAGNYNIPLAYVRVANGFGASTALGNEDVAICASVPGQTRATGVATLRPANSNSFPISGGAGMTRLPWPIAADRPSIFLPSSLSGAEGILVAMRFDSTGTDSHTDGNVVDDSRDWKNRIFKATIMGGTADLAFAGGNLHNTGVPYSAGTAAANCIARMGNSFEDGLILSLTHDNYAGVIPANVSVALRVDSSPTHRMVCGIAGLPGAYAFALFIWLEATAPYANP